MHNKSQSTAYAQSLNTDKLTFQESNEDSLNSLDAINIMVIINIIQDLVSNVQL